MSVSLPPAEAIQAKSKLNLWHRISGDRPKTEVKGADFNQNLFIGEVGTGVNITNRHRKGEGTSEKIIVISEDLKRQYTNFLSTYIPKLNDIRNDPNPVRRAVLDTQEHASDRELLSRLTTDGKIDDKKIQQFLSTSQGLMITTHALEQQTAMQLAALNQYVATAFAGVRENAAREMTLPNEEDRGLLNRFFRDTIGGPLRDHAFYVANRGPGGLLDGVRRWQVILASGGAGVGAGLAATLGVAGAMPAIIAAPPAAAAAAGFAGAMGVITVMRSLTKAGVQFDFQHSQEMFDAVNNNASERDFVREVYGIDTANPINTVNFRDLQDNCLQNVHSRSQFFKEIGVRAENLDAMPEQFIVQNLARPEQNLAIMEQRTWKLYSAGPPLPTVTARIEWYWKCRRQVMMDMLAETSRSRITEAGETTQAITTIDAKIKAREPGGSLRKEREEQIDKRTTRLNEEKTAIEGVKAELEQYTTQLTALEDARRAFNELMQSRYSTYASADVAIGAIEDVINGAYNPGPPPTGPVPVRIGGTQFTSINQKLYEAEQALQTRSLAINAGGGSDEVKGKALDKLEETIEKRRAKINADAEKLQALIAELRQAVEKVQTEQRKLEDRTSLVTTTERVVDRITQNYTDLTGWGITDAQLRAETPEQILGRVNAIFATGGGNGWPPERNNIERIRVLRAITESRAREVTPALATPGSADFVALGPLGLTENQIRLFTPAEIVARAGWLAPPPPLPRAQAVIEEARQRFTGARIAAINRRTAEIDNAVSDLNQEKQGINYDQEIERLRFIKDVLSRRDGIIADADKITSDRERFCDRRFPPATIPVAERDMSPAEIAVGLPAGYYRILDTIFNYRNNPDLNRDTYFQRIQRDFPPTRVINSLNTTLGLGLILPAPPAAVTALEVQQALDIMNARIGLRRLTTLEMGNAFRNVANELRREALDMP